MSPRSNDRTGLARVGPSGSTRGCPNRPFRTGTGPYATGSDASRPCGPPGIAAAWESRDSAERPHERDRQTPAWRRSQRQCPAGRPVPRADAMDPAAPDRPADRAAGRRGCRRRGRRGHAHSLGDRHRLSAPAGKGASEGGGRRCRSGLRPGAVRPGPRARACRARTRELQHHPAQPGAGGQRRRRHPALRVRGQRAQLLGSRARPAHRATGPPIAIC